MIFWTIQAIYLGFHKKHNPLIYRAATYSPSFMRLIIVFWQCLSGQFFVCCICSIWTLTLGSFTFLCSIAFYIQLAWEFCDSSSLIFPVQLIGRLSEFYDSSCFFFFEDGAETTVELQSVWQEVSLAAFIHHAFVALRGVSLRLCFQLLILWFRCWSSLISRRFVGFVFHSVWPI